MDAWAMVDERDRLMREGRHLAVTNAPDSTLALIERQVRYLTLELDYLAGAMDAPTRAARLAALEARRQTTATPVNRAAAWVRTLTDAELDEAEALCLAAAAYPTPAAAFAALPAWAAWVARFAAWCQGQGEGGAANGPL